MTAMHLPVAIREHAPKMPTTVRNLYFSRILYLLTNSTAPPAMTYAAGVPTLVIQAMHESHTMQLKAEKLERIAEVMANMSRQLLSRSAEGTEVSFTSDAKKRV